LMCWTGEERLRKPPKTTKSCLRSCGGEVWIGELIVSDGLPRWSARRRRCIQRRGISCAWRTGSAIWRP